jgi:hypothetical protein
MVDETDHFQITQPTLIVPKKLDVIKIPGTGGSREEKSPNNGVLQNVSLSTINQSQEWGSFIKLDGKPTIPKLLSP